MIAARRLLSGAALAALLAGGSLLGRDLTLRAKGALAGVLIDRAWEAHLEDGRAHPPWPWADFTPVARLEVGRLGIDTPILSDATGRTLAFGLGRITGTADLRAGGDRTGGAAADTAGAVAAIAGHRDTWAAFLERLAVGDTLVVRTGDAPRRYRVVALEVVDAGTTRVVPETGIVSGDGRRLLLVTCWPFGSTRRGTARYVVDCRGEG